MHQRLKSRRLTSTPLSLDWRTAVGVFISDLLSHISLSIRCALILRDLVNPYLLRRLKKDVQLNIPSKSEHVLFCAITEAQQTSYLNFLKSDDCRIILAGRKNALMGIGVLRVRGDPQVFVYWLGFQIELSRDEMR